MKTRAVRLYGESDLRLEEFDMGELKDDEILMELITDSVCMSTYKESIQGAKHQRVNDDISEHPIIVGHEFAGIIREVGAKWKDKYQVGTKYTMQPAINIKGSMAAIGYSYPQAAGFWFILYSFCFRYFFVPISTFLWITFLSFKIYIK